MGMAARGKSKGSARSFSPKSPLELGEKLSPLPGGPGADPRIWPGPEHPESDVGAGGEEEAGSPSFPHSAGRRAPEVTGAGAWQQLDWEWSRSTGARDGAHGGGERGEDLPFPEGDAGEG